MSQLSTKDVLPFVGVCAGVAGLLIFVVKYRKRKVWPNDVVVIHQFPRGPRAPNISPYCLKLETYLRMAEIPYKVDPTWTMSTKGKMPWITYNGVDVADSSFCMKYLNKKFDVDLNKQLTGEQKGIARAFVALMENSMVNFVAGCRWVYYPQFVTTYFRQTNGIMGYLIVHVIRRKVRSTLWQEGTGRHSKEEVFELAEHNLKALSDYLGTKAYLTGSEPCEADCSVFGVLAQSVWHMPDTPIEKMIKEQFPNLRDYCERIKEKYWPDWDQCITHDYTTTATK